MMLLLLAALPGLFWEGGVDTAPALKDAGIAHVWVPPANSDSWKGVNGITVEAADLSKAVKLPTPTVNYRMNQASASREPWLVTNGWKFLRQPEARFYYEAPGEPAALAAAESFAYGGSALIKTDAAGLKPLARMLDFLKGLNGESMPPVADIGYIDDGSATSGEVLNLMVRDNLLVRLERAPDRALKLNVRLGAREYPLEDAKNPKVIAQAVRTNLTDEKRSLRIYGSPVVVARLTGSAGHLRVQLINYAGAARKVNGVRVRVLGSYPQHHVAADDIPGAELLDYTVDAEATEFTLPELKTFAVVDLSR
ncbi:MAG TPA: hypothetical protein VGH38_28810 [Bryobacteraceae bacterium]